MYISMNIGRSITEEPDLKNRLLYKTLELELKYGGGLQVVKNSFNETENAEKFDQRKRYPLIPKDITSGTLREDKDYTLHKTKQLGLTQKFQQTMNITQRILDEENINDHGHNGLLSSLIMEHQKKHEYIEQLKSEISDNNLDNPRPVEIKTFNNLKLMVCITMYKEPLTQLQKSIDGVVQSLDAFLGQGIAPHQVAITVFFDGIENIHNVIDENGSSFHDNIISYFKGHLDDEYGIKGKKTLDYQYWEYKKHKKRMHDYSPQNIINMQRNRELLLKKYKKYKASLLPTMKANKNGIWMPQDEWIESHIIEAMIHQYHLSKKYIDDRLNSAWVYQGRHIHKGCTMPIFYVFKFTNGSKLSSHLWFFKGFCQELQPDYCLLMDCGAIPGKDSIFKLIMAMEADPKLGGVCGNMRIEEEKESDKQNQPMDILSRVLNQNFFSIQKCQSCEYDIGHLLDKQYESSLNYIHVLPGAFSAYRYLAFTQQYVENSKDLEKIKSALHKWQENISDYESQQQSQFLLHNKVIQQENILDTYLRQVLDKNYEYGSIKEANMFLAEDRVLCQLLFCNNYYLRYIPDAIVYVDACLSLVDLLFQRRRWINGSWFALEYVADTYHDKLQNCKHSNWDKMLFRFSIVLARIGQLQQYFFQTFQIVWLFMILQVAIGDNTENSNNLTTETAGNIIVSAVIALYIFLIMTLIYLSITYNASILNNVKGNNEKDKQQKQEQIKTYYYSKYYGISTVLGLISLATVAYTFYLLIDQIIINQYFTQFISAPNVPQSYYYLFLVISCGILASPFLLALFTSPTSVFSVGVNSIHYFYYQPTYTHLFITYAFCRIDDLSWGTKGLTEDNEQRKLNTDKQYKKFLFITKWIVSNCLASGILILFLRMKVFLLPQCLILIVSVILTVISILKGLLAIIYHCKFYLPGGYKGKRDKIITKKQNESTLSRGKEYNSKLTMYFSAKSSN